MILRICLLFSFLFFQYVPCYSQSNTQENLEVTRKVVPGYTVNINTKEIFADKIDSFPSGAILALDSTTLDSSFDFEYEEDLGNFSWKPNNSLNDSFSFFFSTLDDRDYDYSLELTIEVVDFFIEIDKITVDDTIEFKANQPIIAHDDQEINFTVKVHSENPYARSHLNLYRNGSNIPEKIIRIPDTFNHTISFTKKLKDIDVKGDNKIKSFEIIVTTRLNDQIPAGIIDLSLDLQDKNFKPYIMDTIEYIENALAPIEIKIEGEDKDDDVLGYRITNFNGTNNYTLDGSKGVLKFTFSDIADPNQDTIIFTAVAYETQENGLNSEPTDILIVKDRREISPVLIIDDPWDYVEGTNDKFFIKTFDRNYGDTVSLSLLDNRYSDKFEIVNDNRISVKEENRYNLINDDQEKDKIELTIVASDQGGKTDTATLVVNVLNKVDSMTLISEYERLDTKLNSYLDTVNGIIERQDSLIQREGNKKERKEKAALYGGLLSVAGGGVSVIRADGANNIGIAIGPIITLVGSAISYFSSRVEPKYDTYKRSRIESLAIKNRIESYKRILKENYEESIQANDTYGVYEYLRDYSNNDERFSDLDKNITKVKGEIGL